MFQSAPANYGGRIPRGRFEVEGRPCFNPRPPITAGESSQVLVMRRSGLGFNPRPPITAGESLPDPPQGARPPRFNPRPPITAGESLIEAAVQALKASFNPRPPITAGESPGGRHRRRQLAVSIRARQLRRANPATMRRNWSASQSFNPRPPITAGESHGGVFCAGDDHVSIRARQLRRANQQVLDEFARLGWFQSAPANYGGRIEQAHVPIYSVALFQSAPANYGGRIRGARAHPGVPGGFNPRPPITAGESVGRVRAAGFPEVSIRARQLRRANPAWPPGWPRRAMFQSAPANYGGRIGQRLARYPTPSRFNPRPPITAGESRPAPASGPLRRGFNPRPPITAGESLLSQLVE